MSGKVIPDFLENMRQSVEDGTFVKLSLGGYKGTEDLKKIAVRRITIKRENRLSFTYSYKTKDIVKNYTFEEAYEKIGAALREGFGAATLFTTAFDLSYPSLKKTKATNETVPSSDHDVAKKRHVTTAGKSYLHELGITDAGGAVYKNAQDKYRQIDKYIEILGGLIKPGKAQRIVDMGAGKGYLTFALYDYLQTQGIAVDVTGVEYRKDLVDLCNSIAKKSGFDRLRFAQGTVEDYDAKGVTTLIALHACDTATDDAIAKGVQAGADLIVVAPCCHKQIRREMEKNKSSCELEFILKYGTLLERQAEMATDAMRGLLLEHAGYAVKLFEFISDAHTPKNVMIVAQKTGKKNDAAWEKFVAAKKFFGIGEHYLEKQIGNIKP